MNTRELFYRYLAQTSSFPLALEIERAEGMYMYGRDGKKYLDLMKRDFGERTRTPAS